MIIDIEREIAASKNRLLDLSLRNLGGLMFLTVRDETGIVQIISNNPDEFKDITRESTITVLGKVKLRTLDMINKNMR